MIAVPWFTFPWTTATADTAFDLVERATAGDAEARGQIAEVKRKAAVGHPLAVEALKCFNAVAKLVQMGQPPPSVILQMRGVKVGQLPPVPSHGGFLPGGYHAYGQGMYSPWAWRGADPWEVEFGQVPPFPGGVPLLPWGYGGFSPWGGYGADPWQFEEMMQAVAERAADEAAAEARAAKEDK